MKNAREGLMNEILCADDLVKVMVSGSEEEIFRIKVDPSAARRLWKIH